MLRFCRFKWFGLVLSVYVATVVAAALGYGELLDEELAGTAQAAEIKQIPTDSLKRVLLRKIARLERLDFWDRVGQATSSGLTLDWGDGIVHSSPYFWDSELQDMLPEGFPEIPEGWIDSAVQWQVFDKRGERVTETLHLAFLVDAVPNADGEYPEDLFGVVTGGKRPPCTCT